MRTSNHRNRLAKGKDTPQIAQKEIFPIWPAVHPQSCAGLIWNLFSEKLHILQSID